MQAFRKRLSTLTTIWMLFQVVSLSALTSGVCCALHAQDAQGADELCHRSPGATKAAPADHCPMAGPDGHPCPEHAGTTSTTGACTMTGTCNAPTAMLASLFSAPGILIDRIEIRVDLPSNLVAAALPRIITGSFSLDTPPPRL